MPQISIIVPVYNVEKYLEQCLNSILAQTFADYELILIDDGSKDKSREICEEFAKKDERIVFIHQDNKGVSATRNRGIDISNGKYIIFCDSDDEVFPKWLEILYNISQEYKDCIPMCDIAHLERKNKLEICERHEEQVEVLNSYFDVWQTGLSGYTVNRLYKNEIIKNNKIFFNVDSHYAEDSEFNVKYYNFETKTAFIKDKLYLYYDNPNSLVKTKYFDFFPIFSRSFTVRLPLISEENREYFCNQYLGSFIRMLNIVFDRNDPKSLLKKIAFNQKIVSSEPFQTALKYSTGDNEKKIVKFLLKTRVYAFYYCFMRIQKIKHKIIGG